MPPTWEALVTIRLCNLGDISAIRIHQIQIGRLSPSPNGSKDDLLAIWPPCRVKVITLITAGEVNSRLIASIRIANARCIHHIYIGVTAAVGDKGHLLAIRRPRWTVIGASGIGR